MLLNGISLCPVGGTCLPELHDPEEFYGCSRLLCIVVAAQTRLGSLGVRPSYLGFHSGTSILWHPHPSGTDTICPCMTLQTLSEILM